MDSPGKCTSSKHDVCSTELPLSASGPSSSTPKASSRHGRSCSAERQSARGNVSRGTARPRSARPAAPHGSKEMKAANTELIKRAAKAAHECLWEACREQNENEIRHWLQRAVQLGVKDNDLHFARRALASIEDKRRLIAKGCGQQPRAVHDEKRNKNVDSTIEKIYDGKMYLQWKLSEWLSSLKVHEAIADVLCSEIGADSPGVQISVLKKLGKSSSGKEVERMLREGHILKVLANTIWTGAQAMGSENEDFSVNHKFQQEGNTFGLTYGGLSTFYAGLEGLLGRPDRQIMKGMCREHCASADSLTPFRTSNTEMMTTSKAEWHFVVHTEHGPEHPELSELCLDGWPSEGRGRHEHRRRNRPLSDFKEELSRLNTILHQAHEPLIMDEEVCGLRLYTGPMFMKYNGVLRAFVELSKSEDHTRCRANSGDADATSRNGRKMKCDELCLGNRYVTTLHVINSGIVKSGKATRATKVYRGIQGGVLPDEFWNPNEFNVCGGIEFAFMSTTVDRDVALNYASGGSVGTIFEIQMGMIDRGADLAWISQYPHEKEICFAPLTGLEVSSTRVEGSVLVVEMRLNVNLAALTIEQVLQKRQKVVSDMCANLAEELHRDLLGADWQDLADEVDFAELPALAEEVVVETLTNITNRPPADFNDDQIMHNAMQEVLATVGDARQQRAKILQAVADRTDLTQASEAKKIKATAALYLKEEAAVREVTVSGVAPVGGLSSVKGGALALIGLRSRGSELEPALVETCEQANGRKLDTLLTQMAKQQNRTSRKKSKLIADTEEPLGPGWRLSKVNGHSGNFQSVLNQIYSFAREDLKVTLTFTRPLTMEEASTRVARIASSCEVCENVSRCSRRIRRLLALNPDVELLHLKERDLGEMAGEALAKAMEKNASIRELYLGNNDLGDRAGEALAQALETNTTISRLGLNNTNLGRKAIQALAKTLERNTSIQFLGLSTNDLSDECGETLARALEKNTTINKLVLDGNKLGDKSGDALLRALERNQSVQYLGVNGNMLSSTTREALTKTLDERLHHRAHLQKVECQALESFLNVHNAVASEGRGQ